MGLFAGMTRAMFRFTVDGRQVYTPPIARLLPVRYRPYYRVREADVALVERRAQLGSLTLVFGVAVLVNLLDR